MMMIIMSMMFFSILFMFMNHPLSFGLILLIQTLNVALLSGNLNNNFWYSYILFLVMVGGMLILFIYMTSIASNEKFNFSSKLFFFTNLFFIIICLSLLLDFYLMNFKSYNIIMSNFNTNSMNNLSMNKYINFPNCSIFYLMIIYLLITLIAVVKITKIEYGPLRQKF
uniref:NADH-ubiquinone oxidoreductase chain 6 n=1 Tax=Kateretes pedicularius TaxID=877986 RepID=S4SWU7_9CUCU|nr:NADH dehydrogenase subunit 6 [Kateretes pedicularius]